MLLVRETTYVEKRLQGAKNSDQFSQYEVHKRMEVHYPLTPCGSKAQQSTFKLLVGLLLHMIYAQI